MSIHALSQCGKCRVDFNAFDCPVQSGEILVTSCFHVYHPRCLSRWVTGSENSCPTCRNTVYQHQAGKDFTIIWKVFIKALNLYPSTVLEALTLADHQKDKECCSSCLEELPSTSLYFNLKEGHLIHQGCSPNQESVSLAVEDISLVVRKCAEKYPELAQILTPIPPSLYERARRDHPNLFKLAIFSIVSGCALLINTRLCQGKNKLLFFMGLPVLLIAKLVEKAGIIVLNFSDQPD